jgi:NAD(P)-dependent dehydrogenase (short-subunit alcohol dehydrogenase family)
MTGSSCGIGLATAKAFAAEDCRLMLSARSAEQLATAEAVLRTSGTEIAPHVADVSEPDEAAGLIRHRRGLRAASTCWSTTWVVAEEERALPIAPMTIGEARWSGI